MSLKNQIQDDLKSSMKSGDEIRRGVLRMLGAEIKNSEIVKKDALDDEEVLKVIFKSAKKRRDSIEQYKKGGRNDLAEREEKELEILEKYLPEQINEEEIKKVIREAIKETGAAGVSEFGKVMGIAMGKLKGKADGNLVGRIVKEELGN